MPERQELLENIQHLLGEQVAHHANASLKRLVAGGLKPAEIPVDGITVVPTGNEGNYFIMIPVGENEKLRTHAAKVSEALVGWLNNTGIFENAWTISHGHSPEAVYVGFEAKDLNAAEQRTAEYMLRQLEEALKRPVLDTMRRQIKTVASARESLIAMAPYAPPREAPAMKMHLSFSPPRNGGHHGNVVFVDVTRTRDSEAFDAPNAIIEQWAGGLVEWLKETLHITTKPTIKDTAWVAMGTGGDRVKVAWP